MSTTQHASPRIDQRDLRGFPRAVARIIAEAVNNHGVEYRQIDATHIRLYNGDRTVVPMKVAGSRQAEYTVRRLIPWLEKNVESWTEGEVDASSIMALAEALETEPDRATTEPVRATPVVEPAEDSDWRPYKYGFETDGTNYRCTTCGYLREGNARGIHLHRCVDPQGRKERMRARGESRALKEGQRKVMRREAVRVLAEQNGLVVFEKGEVDARTIKRLNKEVERLAAESEKWRLKAGELQARMDLMKEAFTA